MKTSQQLHDEAVSRKRSLQMKIRMNTVYLYKNKAKRLLIIEACQKELTSLIIPPIITQTVGYSFSYKTGSYIGSVYNPDLQEATQEACEYENCEPCNIKSEAITAYV